MADFELNASARTEVGKGASRRLRRLESRVPAIIYGGKGEPTNISLAHKEVIKAFENEAVFSHILTVNIDGKPEQALIKDIQRHPFKPRIMHIDFQRITGKETLHRHVTLHFLNEDTAKGVKNGGIITHHMKDIEISCTPATLPEYIEVDLANLELDEVLHLSDLKLPKGVAFLHYEGDAEHDLPVASISLPRAALEPEEGEEGAEEPTAESEEAKPDAEQSDEES